MVGHRHAPGWQQWTDHFGRWIFFAQMLASVDFPFQIPVGDISHLIRSGTERAQDKERFSA